MSGRPLSPEEQRFRALQTAHDRGLTIGEAAQFGATERDLVRVGYRPTELQAAGYDAAGLQQAGVSCRDLLQIAWPADELYETFGDAQVGQALRDACAGVRAIGGRRNRGEVPLAPVISITALYRAGFEVADLHAAGFRAAELKTQGAWWTAEEQEVVDAVYTPEELDEEFARRVAANQVDYPEIAQVRDEFLEAAARYFSHRSAKRSYKKRLGALSHYSGKTLKKLRAETVKLQERVARWRNAEKRARAEGILARRLELIDRISAQKAEYKAAYEASRDKLKGLLERRRSYVKDQKKVIAGKIKPLLTRLRDARLARAREAVALNDDFVQRSFPLYQRTSEENRRLLRLRAYYLGDPDEVDVAAVQHPSRDEQDAGARPGRAGGGPRREKPLEDIVVLDRKIEQLTWSVDEFGAELELLDEARRLIDRSKSLWTFVDKIEKWHPRLLHLANSVTTVTRATQLLKKAGHKVAPSLVGEGKWTKRKRITGQRDFALEFGVSAGVSVGIADVMAGLSLALSGNLRVDDDRRLRANITLKLIPNFKAEVKGGSAALVEATAKCGFTITSQTYAFVDEKHFAYYFAFRMANLLRFSDKFTRYGNAALHQHIAVYDDEIMDLLRSIVGTAKMNELEFYLSKRHVWKVHVPAKGKFIPATDLGFKDAVLGGSVDVKHNYTLSVMQRQRLVLPDATAESGSSSDPDDASRGPQVPDDAPQPGPARHEPVAVNEPAAYDGPTWWKVEARGDGHCAYNSIAFLLKHHQIGGPDQPIPSVPEIRRIAAARWRTLYEASEQRGRAHREEMAEALAAIPEEEQEVHDAWRVTPEGRFWQFDDENYESIEDFIQWQTTGTADPGRRRNWANAQILAALADYYQFTLQIFQGDGQPPLILPLDAVDDEETPLLQVALEGYAHYNALVPNETDEPPEVPEELLGERIVQVAGEPVHFAHAPEPDEGSAEGSEEDQVVVSDADIRDAVIAAEDPEVAPQVARIQPMPPIPNEARPALRPSLAEARRREDWLNRRSAPRLVTDIRRGKSWGLAFSVGLKAFINTQIDVEITQIVRNNNPDNDGFYIKLRLTGSLFTRSAEKSFLTNEEKFEFPGTEDWSDSIWRNEDDPGGGSLTGSDEPSGLTDARETGETLQTNPEEALVKAIVDKVPDETKEKFSDIAREIGKTAKNVVENALKEIYQTLPDQLQDQLAAIAGSVQNVSVGVDIQRAKRSLELNYVAVGKTPRLQYVRWVYASGFGLKGSLEVPVFGPAAVGVSGEVKFGKTVALNERLGRNTLSYVLTVFNGLRQRIDGLSQWREFLADHTNSIRKMYRRIGSHPDSITALDAAEFDRAVRDNTAHWQDHEDWCTGAPNQASDFLEACRQAAEAGDLDNVWNARAARSRFRTLRPGAVGTMINLHDKFTTLLWRYAQVQKLDNERKYPFKQKTVYLRPPEGRLSVEIRYRVGRRMAGDRASSFQVISAPVFDGHKTSGVYRSVVDILKNNTLANAENLLPFYEAGFEITLELKGLGYRAVIERLGREHPDVRKVAGKPPGTVRITARQPDGEDAFKKVLMDLVAAATKKRNQNLSTDAFETKIGALYLLTDALRIDPDLHARFAPWITALWRDKHTYPSAELPLRRESRENLGEAWEAEIEASDDTRANWIRKAHQLFDDWVHEETRLGHIDPDGEGARDAFEFILTQVAGPFPGIATRSRAFRRRRF